MQTQQSFDFKKIKLSSQKFKWPRVESYEERYFVPDLSPNQRKELTNLKPKFVFVAESPHISEVAPEVLHARRPLCGKAGQEWWKMLGEILEGEVSADTDIERMLRLCKKHRFAVLNAVQFPMDQNVVKQFEDASPSDFLGFNKAGEFSYKKMKNDQTILTALENLKTRLNDPSFKNAKVICLGLDSKWFTERALQIKDIDVLPHPSAWWRRGGFFRQTAKEKLKKIFSV